MTIPTILRCGLVITGLVLAGCDPLYGGVHNYYPDAVTVKLDTNDPKVASIITLSPGQGFAYHEPTKMLGIEITTATGKTATYSSVAIDTIVTDLHESNENISWALTPEGLFADCVQHTVIVDCRKPGTPPSQWKESP